MKTTFTLFFIFLAYQAKCQEFQFRRTNWNMSKAEVIASEGPRKPILNSGNNLHYGGITLGSVKNIKVSYQFENDMLIEAGYFLNELNTSKGFDGLDLYLDAIKLLETKYGTPEIANDMTEKQLEEISPGHALIMGIFLGSEDLDPDLKALIWKTPLTAILATIHNPGWGHSTHIDYYYRLTRKQVFPERKKPKLSDF